MEFLEHKLPSKLETLNLKYEEIVLAPIGDVHYGAQGFAARSFSEYLKILREEYDNVYYVGMGDYIDATRATVRKSFKQMAVDDGSFCDEYIDYKIQELTHILSQTRGKWLGMLQGNHSWDFRDGSTTESKLCAALDAPYLGDCADVQIKFHAQDKIRGTVGVWMHHGVGGRKYPVGKLLDHVCPYFPDSDIFLMGHTHVREYRDVVRMHRMSGGYIQKTGVAAITGGWLKGYTAGPSSYIERKALLPLAIGSIIIKIRPRLRHGYFMPSIRVESI